jgi:hypothetical protein
MPNYLQPLLFTVGWPLAWLREITGFEEQNVAGTHVSDAIALVDRLLVKGHRPEAAAKDLVSADRDRVLAAIYAQTFSDRIHSTLDCPACAALYDMDFSLSGFAAHTYATAGEGVPDRQPDGTYTLSEGIRLRLPTGEDELMVSDLDEATAARRLLEKCLVQGEVEAAEAEAETVLSKIAPMLQTEMVATCPECSHTMTVLFDIQTYLLQSLLQDQERLTWEIHRIASAYHWSLMEILRLPRSMRRNYARIIEAERV